MELRKIRKELRMTQIEFSELLGLTQGYLSELETGKSPVTQNIINALKDNSIPYEITKDNLPLMIPIVDVRASAGPGVINSTELITDTIESSERFLNQFGEKTVIITISGDSMEPTISHNDWLLVHKQEVLQSEGIFVFIQDNELRVKRIQKEISGRILVISDNPKYQTEIYDANSLSVIDTKIIGKVVGIIQHI